MPSVLFVCTANICRSPMAEALWRIRLGDAAGWRVESAGTWAMDGQPAARYAQQVIQQRGSDLSQHRSRVVDKELLESFRLILVMEQGHKEALRFEFPAIASRVYLLSEMEDESQDIHDPVGGSMLDFEEAARELDCILEKGSEKIRRLAGERS
jgi:protein-tyrosine-phosphatase